MTCWRVALQHVNTWHRFVCLFGSINAACRWRVTGVQFTLRPTRVAVSHLMAVSPHNALLQTELQNFAFRDCETTWPARAGRQTRWCSLWTFVDWRFKRVTWQKQDKTKPKHRQSKGWRGFTEAFSAILLNDPSGSRVWWLVRSQFICEGCSLIVTHAPQTVWSWTGDLSHVILSV